MFIVYNSRLTNMITSMKTTHLTTTLALALTLAGSGSLHAKTAKFKLTDCPDAVQKTFTAQVGKGTIIEAEKETGKDGKSVFEAKIKTAEGKDGEIVVTADGALIQNEAEVLLKDCPAAVQAGLQGAVKDGAIVKVEKITKADGTVQYEADIRKKDGAEEEEMEAVVAADGKVISVVETDDEEEKDKEKDHEGKKAGGKKEGGKDEKDDDDDDDDDKEDDDDGK